jgi:hypothetical protein
LEDFGGVSFANLQVGDFRLFFPLQFYKLEIWVLSLQKCTSWENFSLFFSFATVQVGDLVVIFANNLQVGDFRLFFFPLQIIYKLEILGCFFFLCKFYKLEI